MNMQDMHPIFFLLKGAGSYYWRKYNKCVILSYNYIYHSMY